MSDKYGYIGIETLLNFCSNQKDHCVTPNDFMRMNRVKIDERPHGEWRDFSDDGYVECPFCEHATTCNDDIEELHFCFFCGASMSANDKQVIGKLNKEPKDSHAEYWNSIGEWKEGEAE